MNYVICKEECSSENTIFFKYKKYRYDNNASIYDVKVYDEFGAYVFFFEKDFKDLFYTEKELRKEKLKIIYEEYSGKV